MVASRSLSSYALWVGSFLAVTGFVRQVGSTEAEELVLPEDVRVVWDVDSAARQTTETRQSLCINGLWRWQPGSASDEHVPRDNWGYFKVPGPWPGITNYMQKDCQAVHRHPSWKKVDISKLTAAWYEREISIPDHWTGRRMVLDASYVNSLATVFLDRRPVGTIRFPGGQLDLSDHCRPGATHILSILLVAAPLKNVLLSYTDSAAAREVAGTVARRGLCGDVFLASMPRGPRISDVQIAPSVRNWQITLDVAVNGLQPAEPYQWQADILDGDRVVHSFRSSRFTADDLQNGRMVETHGWRPDKLWDTITPQNVYHLRLTLLDAGGETLDATYPVRFGFREFWIDGRDFYLNGSRIYLSAVPLDNAQVSAAAATYEQACESLRRLKSFGINFVYTHNYGCQPGSHLSFSEILRAADDTGMLVALSQPHFSHYQWEDEDADRTNGYARHAEFYVRVAQNHPAVVAYSMSHNATGYSEDMNPDLIDGIHDRRTRWSLRNAERALRAEAIVRQFDSKRIIYHHSSGNLGSMHTSNFYPNFVPIQEMSDWFEHWATKGIKPVFLCEYGAPFAWDWTMYRGWYQGRREFGSARVPWEFCLAEWNAQFFGDRAFMISDREKENLRWEARQFQAGRLWHRWDYPHVVGSEDFQEREPVYAKYFEQNWRAFRTWGLSANSPWEHHLLWRLRDGVDKSRRELPTDWEHLQRPGFSPDYLDERYERMDMAFDQADWVATEGAKALLRNNGPVLAYIAGKPSAFTSRDHNVSPGRQVHKQIIVINNSRRTISCQCRWHVEGIPDASGSHRIELETGTQKRIPITFRVPDDPASESCRLVLYAHFDLDEEQHDVFTFDVVPKGDDVEVKRRVALFDPQGDTARMFERLGVTFTRIGAKTALDDYDVLVIGRRALAPDAPAPNIERVRNGLKVLVFEQTAETLERRFGFRVADYGLRQVFPRIPDHPLLAGLTASHLHDWCGEATLVPPRRQYELSEKFSGAPSVTWCGLEVTRLWRCGCRGNVASVTIEKPARGDFLPILDGGFSLQYSPLLEYREGRGVVVLCQLDVTGRSEPDPAARHIVSNLVRYVDGWQAPPRRQAYYLGPEVGRQHFRAAGITFAPIPDGPLSADHALVVASGGSELTDDQLGTIQQFVGAGGRLLAIGLNQDEASALLPTPITMRRDEHIATWFEPPGLHSAVVGVGPADVHNRAPRTYWLVSDGLRPLGNGVLGTSLDDRVVVCQLVPWEFDDRTNYGLKRTFRRSSYLVNRLMANLGPSGTTPLLERFSAPVADDEPARWLVGFYLDEPEEWDDPYRFFRW